MARKAISAEQKVKRAEIDARITSNVFRLKEESGKTWDELAAAIGVSGAAIARVERAKRWKASEIELLAGAIGCEVGELYADKGKKSLKEINIGPINCNGGRERLDTKGENLLRLGDSVIPARAVEAVSVKRDENTGAYEVAIETQARIWHVPCAGEAEAFSVCDTVATFLRREENGEVMEIKAIKGE